jgi:hypothetical protein
MKKHSEAFIGFDAAKKKHAVAIADVGREGEIRYLGEIDSSPAAVERVMASWRAATRSCGSATKPVRRGTDCTARFGPWVTTVPSSRHR